MTYKPFNRVDWFPNEFGERALKSKADFEFLNSSYLSENFYLNSFFKGLKEVNFLKNSLVLDIGCGWGSSTKYLSKYSKKVTSIDISQVAIEGAKTNLSFDDITNSELIEMDAENLSFPDSSYDFVYSWGVIHHSSDPGKIISEIYRVMRAGGKGTIMVYNKSSLRYWLLGFYQLYIRRQVLSGYNWSNIGKKFTDGFYHKHYISKELKKEFLSNGFSDVKIKISHYLGKGKILPFINTNSFIGKILRKRFGYFLIVEFKK